MKRLISSVIAIIIISTTSAFSRTIYMLAEIEILNPERCQVRISDETQSRKLMSTDDGYAIFFLNVAHAITAISDQGWTLVPLYPTNQLSPTTRIFLFSKEVPDPSPSK